jgi:broad specificity phosphatase PhoE
MKLIVIRHALTEANEQEFINGQFDDLLSENGRKEIPSIVKKLHPYKFDVIYSSPLKRAMETAMPVAEDHKVEIDVDRHLIEVNMGSFTRKPFASTVEELGMHSSELLNTYAYDLRSYGGESSEEVKHRVNSFLSDLKTSNHSSVLVVTHGGIIRWFYYLCKGEKVGRSPNLSVHAFEI